MKIRSCITTLHWVIVGGLLAMGCSGGAGESTESIASTQQSADARCKQSEPKDALIAELVHVSLLKGYALTRLSVDGAGMIAGSEPPDEVAGQLEVINGVEEARASVAAAIADIEKTKKVKSLPDYVVTSTAPGDIACNNVPAWTPSGPTTITTGNIIVAVTPETADSWQETHKAFGKQCPLVKRNANDDTVVDPPGDGSTSLPPSETVSDTGSRANAFGLCPSVAEYGSYCKMSYATDINYTGRSCQAYGTGKRCLLY